MSLKTLAAGLALAVALVTPTHAQSTVRTTKLELLDSYTARISPRDLVNSSGGKLSTAAQAIRQDRANFHALNKADAEDIYDLYFHDRDARAKMEDMLNRGSISPQAARLIMSGKATIYVEILGTNAQPRELHVTVLD